MNFMTMAVKPELHAVCLFSAALQKQDPFMPQGFGGYRSRLWFPGPCAWSFVHAGAVAQAPSGFEEVWHGVKSPI